MAEIQTSRAVAVYYALQAGIGVPAVGGDPSLVFPFNEGAKGLSMSTQKIRSTRNVRNGQSRRGRHGSRQVGGSYPVSLSLKELDTPLEAVVRGTWDAAITIDQTTGGANLVSGITTTANSIVGASGSFLAQNLRADDVIVLSGHSSAGNNNRNIHILDIPNPTTLVTQETLTVNAVNDTSFSILRPKKLVNPANPVRRLFTIEEYYAISDAAELFVDCRFISAKFSMQPNGMVIVELGVLGRDMNIRDGIVLPAPYFTAPVETPNIELTAADASIMLGGEVLPLSGCEFTLDLGGSVDAVIGSVLGRDVSEGNMKPITGTISIQQENLDQLADYLNETELKLNLHLVEPEAEPKSFFDITLLNLTLDGSDKTLGQDGPLVREFPFEAGILIDPTAAEENAMVKMQTSAT